MMLCDLPCDEHSPLIRPYSVTFPLATVDSASDVIERVIFLHVELASLLHLSPMAYPLSPQRHRTKECETQARTSSSSRFSSRLGSIPSCHFVLRSLLRRLHVVPWRHSVARAGRLWLW